MWKIPVFPARRKCTSLSEGKRGRSGKEINPLTVNKNNTNVEEVLLFAVPPDREIIPMKKEQSNIGKEENAMDDRFD